MDNSNIQLEDCKLITNEEYLDLPNPQFKGQTRLENDGGYYMVWEDNGILYKTYNKL